MMTSTLAHARLCLPLAAALGLTAVTGCDLLELPEDEVASDTDGDDEGEEDDGDGNGLDPTDDESGSDESSGGSDEEPEPGDNEPEPSDDANPFDDDPGQALGALAGMGYACYDAEDTTYNLLFDAEGVTVRFDDGSTSFGSYETTADSLTLSFPEIAFAETTTGAAVALDALVYFETASLQCGAFTFDYTAPDSTEIVTCPTIKYIPGTSWEDNEFHFGDDGSVMRRRWTELPAVPDTLYAERLGVYAVVGNSVYIVLPFEDEAEQVLTGTIADEGLYIDQLEPEQGACE